MPPYSRYHRGDVVRVRDDLKQGVQYYCITEAGLPHNRIATDITPEMLSHAGDIAEILHVHHSSDNTVGWYEIYGSKDSWTDEMFDGIVAGEYPDEPSEAAEPPALTDLFSDLEAIV